MQNQQLLDYIKTQLEQGVDMSTIKQALAGQGWDSAQLEAAFATFSPSEQVPQKKSRGIFFWRSKEKLDEEAFAPYEEIDAKRTSKLGYFFLILMVLFGLWQGNNFLSALQNSITAPQLNSSCLSVLASYLDDETHYSGMYGYYGNYNDNTSQCNYSDREIKLGINSIYDAVSPAIASIRTAEQNISTLNSQISNKQYDRNRTVNDYEASLLERIARSNGTAFDSNSLRMGVISHDDQLATMRTLLEKEQAQKQMLVDSVKAKVAGGRGVIKQAEDGYVHDYKIYQLLQFLLSLVFVAPLFYFLWRRYHASKQARSEYAIIWGGMVAIVSLILAQIILVFIYEILPHKLLQELFAFLAKIKFVWAILYWLGFILVPLFFGYLIYLIQKRFYNKRAIMMRALKSGHCPRCTLKVHESMNHCPVCGHALKTKCSSCGQMSTSGGAYCDSCGVKKV